MSNVKNKVSLSFVMLLVLVMSLSSVFAVNRIFNLTATYNGNTLNNEQTITVKAGDSRKINISVNPTYVDSTLAIGYAWDEEGVTVAATGSKTATITIPNYPAGSTHTLYMEALIKDNAHDYVGNSNVVKVFVKIPAEEVATTISVDLKDGNTTLKNGATVEKTVGSELVIVGTSNKKVKQLAYAWDDGKLTVVDGATAKIKVPNYAEGKTYKLAIQAAAEDNTVSSAKEYNVKIISETPAPVEEKILASVQKINDTTLKLNATVTNGTFDKFVYSWNNGATTTLTTNPVNITVPKFAAGTTNTLKVTAYTKNGKTSTASYTVKVPEAAVIDDELIVESWMKEDSSMEELAVSLRNDSDEYEKGNKNFYALNEEIVYYVDYKNGGDDITREVKLVLELPLDFKVIDSFGGVVNAKDHTITWTFPNGLEEDQAGTKVVKLAYTAFGRSSKKYEIVYPVADIYERNKVVDSSAVINYIYKNDETEITDEHYPYMFGDAGKDTFRPDATITRAEGALVLTRIFGIDTSGTKVENLYPDLNETYVEAQKAIVAATKLGIINGYTDGTYKPNKKMTKAEFMKIIATYIEANAEEEDIRGLEIKEDTNITIYKDTKNKYMTGSTSVNQHWGINAVTLLVRLNMSPIGNGVKSVVLDDDITRAEVAQLVNFYLLRAPADVSSSTKTQFSDVSKKHNLFADIVEATRDEHTYMITPEGFEEAVKD